MPGGEEKPVGAHTRNKRQNEIGRQKPDHLEKRH